MEIIFDPNKDRANRQKHGLSLSDAALMDLDTSSVIPDIPRNYGESRFRAYGAIRGRLHMLVFTVRDDNIRAISLRKANRQEVRQHGPKS